MYHEFVSCGEFQTFQGHIFVLRDLKNMSMVFINIVSKHPIVMAFSYFRNLKLIIM